MADAEKERKPFFIEFKSNYGTNNTTNTAAVAGNAAGAGGGGGGAGSHRNSPTVYFIHGTTHPTVDVGHCHKDRMEGIDKKARKKLIIASILCLVFMTVEIIGGILSNSLAIATDAAHLLTDFAAFMISLFAIWLAGRPSTQRLSFGWYRAEVIGALVSVLMIWAITAILIWLAVNRIINKDYELEADVMLITSGLAIISNLIMGWQLHHSHGHSHGGSHGQTIERQLAITNSGTVLSTTHTSSNSTVDTTSSVEANSKSPIDASTPKSLNENPKSPTIDSDTDTAAEMNPNQQQQQNGHLIRISPNRESVKLQIATDNKSTATAQPDQTLSPASPVASRKRKLSHSENINVRAAFIHVVGDVVQSVGVFIAALIIYFKPEWAIVDPICTFFFSIIVLFTTFKILKDAILVLMEATPDYLHYAEVMNIFLQIDGVERVHNLRIWALSINKCALSAHLAIRPGANPRKILQAANTAVHLKYNFFETTIQIEDFTPEMEECKQCTIPDS